MKKRYILTLLCLLSAASLIAQEEEEVKEKGFKKENLFSGGSISLSFFNNTFLVGANPVLGYRIANWIDAGLVVNYQYSSIRDYYQFDDRLRQTIYGGGAFTRLYPVHFLFAQAQFEHNFITQKYLPPNNGTSARATTSANSMLVGAGYTQGRDKYGNSGFFYLSVLWDVSGSSNSPYTDAYGRSVPIIRAGFNVPLFQGRRGY